MNFPKLKSPGLMTSNGLALSCTPTCPPGALAASRVLPDPAAYPVSSKPLLDRISGWPIGNVFALEGIPPRRIKEFVGDLGQLLGGAPLREDCG